MDFGLTNFAHYLIVGSIIIERNYLDMFKQLIKEVIIDESKESSILTDIQEFSLVCLFYLKTKILPKKFFGIYLNHFSRFLKAVFPTA